LTRREGWGIKDAVIAGFTKASGSIAMRIAALVLFFAFFGLPFHSHALAESPRIAKECSCVHGTRTGVALIVENADWTPLTQVSIYELPLPQVASRTLVHFLAIRAPPLF
jgi:hypothetical protein